MRLRLEAPAKLNLTLTVVGRRPDGYHLLDSTFVLLELADGLVLTDGGGGLRQIGGGGRVPTGAHNLAWSGLQTAMGAGADTMRLELEKRIPVAAGLGGGSSDAAAAWRLGRAWLGETEVATPDDLHRLAAIGADVPFFAAATPAARVGGIGERVEPVEPTRREVLLVHPPFGMSTAAVFAALHPADWGTAENDLLPAARRLRPELEDLFTRIEAAGGEPRLTGSGSTIFSLDDDPERTAALAARLQRDGLRVDVTRTRGAAASIERINEED
ncbi:MAG: 4-(cytidine 5'-diphospho)-2-C-methyl-D-erythritol kinase [Chloroflexi bacterium]|nr:4-(cytidine 5'-diphospho)-2-C-methyl-D-erythritol kinase [Chloroflexota bacterium]